MGKTDYQRRRLIKSDSSALVTIAAGALTCILLQAAPNLRGTGMSAQFWYAEAPSDKHVAVRMYWEEGAPAACVEASAYIAHQLAQLNISHIEGGVGLAFALGYGVTIAGLVGAKLTITGDVSAWPDEWGELTYRPVKQAQRADRAH